MGNDISFLINMILAMGCFLMGLIFIVLPLPSIEGLKNYRISLKVLAATYFLLGSLTVVTIILQMPEVHLLSPIEMVIASTQAILYYLTLTTLFNPSFVTRKFIFRQLIPVALFVILYSIFSFIWNDPTLGNLNDIILNQTHPTVILREIFVLFYALQLIYYTRMFRSEDKIYNQHVDNYFADNYRLHLIWVRYCFYAALIVGTIALFSFFFYSPTWVLITAGIYAVFYIMFGLLYIQYPYTYIEVEKILKHRSGFRNGKL